MAFSIPLPLSAHKLARQHSQKSPSRDRAKQVYLNTLAVFAANSYCQSLEIETDFGASDSQNPFFQTVMDIADLELVNLGKIECRPVLNREEFVRVPIEVWEDRIGYLAVALDDALTEAVFLGFLETVRAENVDRRQWQSIDDFLVTIDRLENPQPTRLDRWFDRIFPAGWQTVETIRSALQTDRPQASFAFRSDSTTSQKVTRGKILDLSGNLLDAEPDDRRLGLFVSIEPSTTADKEIAVELRPGGDRTYLPEALLVQILDSTGKAIMQSEAGQSESLEFEFGAKSGDEFGVKVSLDRVSITETFAV
ncbi:MAG: DUF1822 family protein [Cyanobacteriota bacterium]|nr:DUF1822 family protein [Cyanobacteriota bacterium]